MLARKFMQVIAVSKEAASAQWISLPYNVQKVTCTGGASAVSTNCSLADRLASLVTCDLTDPTDKSEPARQQASKKAVKAVLDDLHNLLDVGGMLIMKLFATPTIHMTAATQRARFSDMYVVKPKNSRASSLEIYLVGVGFDGSRNKSSLAAPSVVQALEAAESAAVQNFFETVSVGAA
eukprot:GHVP01012885.1.p1 GENE.GHVP01012885.1~~GHVP01012885.1.p1  ORF type:complete len:179 (-),score=5.73 GHVP01012885.1:115-651(-)